MLQCATLKGVNHVICPIFKTQNLHFAKKSIYDVFLNTRDFHNITCITHVICNYYNMHHNIMITIIISILFFFNIILIKKVFIIIKMPRFHLSCLISHPTHVCYHLHKYTHSFPTTQIHTFVIQNLFLANHKLI